VDAAKKPGSLIRLAVEMGHKDIRVVVPDTEIDPRAQPRRRGRALSKSVFTRKSRLSNVSLTVTDTLMIGKQAALREMHPITLRFKDSQKEVYYAKHVEKVQKSDVKKLSSKALCVFAILWIVMYDLSGATGNNSDSEEMKEYYTQRTMWNAGVAGVMIAIFITAHQIVARQGLGWRLVSCIGGPILFVFKEGSNMATHHDRYLQLHRAQPDWTEPAQLLAEDYYMQAYFLQSLVGSVVVLLLYHLVFKFDMLSMCLSTTTMCCMSIAVAALMEDKLDATSSMTGNTMTILSMFTALCSVTFCMHSYLCEYYLRVEWLMTQNHIDNLYNVKKPEVGAAIEVGTGMETVIRTLVDLYKKTNEPQLEVVIERLNSGEDLWKADKKQMDELPAWLQEQDTEYMRKKEQDVFFLKHSSPRKKRQDERILESADLPIVSTHRT
jgi:hypothetical protein